MKRLLSNLILFLLPVLALNSCSQCRVRSPQDIKPGEVSIRTPEFEHWKMDTGLEVVYYYRPEIPLFSGSLYLPKGELSNDTGIPGLSGVVVQQMREGGIPGMTPDDFDSLLDMKAAKIEASQDHEVTSVSFSCLSEDFNEVFSYFRQIVASPRFDDQRLRLWKKLSKERIRRRKDSPDTMASMLFSKLLYGQDSPWYAPLSMNSVDKINLNSLQQMHRRLFVPEGAVLVLVGDIESEVLKSVLSSEFSGWKQDHSVKPLPRFVESDDTYSPPEGIYIIESDFEQASILLGHEGHPKENATVYEQVFFNRILGSSGFGSLLFKEIRERRGLVYSIYGGFDSSIKEGSFRVRMGTKAESAVVALTKTYDLLQSIKAGYLPEEEIESSRVATAKSFVFKFEDPAYAATRPVLLDLYGYPENYDEQFVERINSITRDDLYLYAENNLKPDRLFSVIVGRVNPEEVKSQVGDAFTICNVIFEEEPQIESCR
jgi:zinc protease